MTKNLMKKYVAAAIAIGIIILIGQAFNAMGQYEQSVKTSQQSPL